MHVVKKSELIHGSAELQSTQLDQIHALGDVRATCAASRWHRRSQLRVERLGMRRQRLKLASSGRAVSATVNPSLYIDVFIDHTATGTADDQSDC